MVAVDTSDLWPDEASVTLYWTTSAYIRASLRSLSELKIDEVNSTT